MRKRWFIIQTYSGLENSIKEAIQIKIESFGFSHMFGKILVPEETKLDRTNVAAEKYIVPANAKLLVKDNQDVAKGDPVAEEVEIKVKNDGTVAEIKPITFPKVQRLRQALRLEPGLGRECLLQSRGNISVNWTERLSIHRR